MVLMNQHPTPLFPLTAFPPTPDATHLEQTLLAAQPSINREQTLQPHLDSEGRMICDRDGCGRGPFATRNEWK